MCLLIFTPNIRQATIYRSVLARGFDKNDDGAGMAYIENGVLRITKGYFNFDEFYHDYREITERLKGPLLIHFRWLTTGTKKHANTQPFFINDGLAMAHNGKINELSKGEEDVSDSVRLVRLIRRLKWQFPFSRAQHDLLALVCDGSSKLVFLDANGRYQIINAHLGKWRAGSWYSDQCECFKVPSWGYKPWKPAREPKVTTVKQTSTFGARTIHARNTLNSWQHRIREETVNNLMGYVAPSYPALPAKPPMENVAYGTQSDIDGDPYRL